MSDPLRTHREDQSGAAMRDCARNALSVLRGAREGGASPGEALMVTCAFWGAILHQPATLLQEPPP